MATRPRVQTTSRVPQPTKVGVKSAGLQRVESVNVPQTGGNIDQVRILAAAYGEKLAILDEVMFDFTWTEDAADLASVQATITFHNQRDFAKQTLKPGTWLYPQYLNPLTETWVNLDPPLYVWDRTRTDNMQLSADVTAFDIVSFLNRQDTSNWLFKPDKKHKGGWYAHEIAQSILFDFEIKAKLVKGKYKIPYLFLQSHNPYEVIVKAYTRDRQISNILYRIQAIGKQFTVLPYTKQEKVWIISDKSNLLSASWNESLEGVKTEVIALTTAIGGDNTLITGGARATSDLVRQYGRLREVIYLEKKYQSEVLKKFARESLKWVSKTKDTIQIQAEGLLPMRAGDAVYLDDDGTDLHGVFFIRTVTHTVASGAHTMDITLDRSAIVPTNFPTVNELRNGGTAKIDPAKFKAATSAVGAAAIAAGNTLATVAGGTAASNAAVTSGAVFSSDMVGKINQFIGSGHAMSGQGQSMVNASKAYGVDPRVLIIIARKESSFGDAIFAPYNAWGYNVHKTPGIPYQFTSWEEGAKRVAMSLSGSLYKGSGLVLLKQIVPKYAPPGENNTDLYISQIEGWYREMGGDPTKSVFA